MVTDYLPLRAVKIYLAAKDKPTAITEMVDLLCTVYNIKDKSEILAAILEREEMMSTGVGFGIAIPHAKIEDLSAIKMVAGLSEVPIDFDSIDGEPARIFFLMISPKNGSGEHVRILSELSRILNNREVRDEVLGATNPGEFIDIFKKYED